MMILAVIGDLVDSRVLDNRQQVQAQLAAALARVNGHEAGIASPYTLTLGDEFQAVLSDGRRAFGDAVAIQAALHPVLVRFSLVVGTLTTDINPHQALAMDGPAFHQARDGIDLMKREATSLFHVGGLEPEILDLGNASLRLVSHAFRKWQSRRFRILAALHDDVPVPRIAEQLGVSEQAVYKNISDGRLRDVLSAFAALGTLLDRPLAVGR